MPVIYGKDVDWDVSLLGSQLHLNLQSCIPAEVCLSGQHVAENMHEGTRSSNQPGFVRWQQTCVHACSTVLMLSCSHFAPFALQLEMVDPGTVLMWIFGSILALLWLLFVCYGKNNVQVES